MWIDYLRLLEKYGGQLDEAAPEELARAALGLVNHDASRRIAEIYYHRMHRKDPASLPFSEATQDKILTTN